MSNQNSTKVPMHRHGNTRECCLSVFVMCRKQGAAIFYLMLNSFARQGQLFHKLVKDIL